MTETLTSFAHGSVASMQWLDHTGSAKAIPVVQLQENLRKLIAEHADTRTQLERKSDAVQRLWAERDALIGQVVELSKDAERYRWLRRTQVELSLSNDTIAGLVRSVGDIDAAIDAQKGKV